MSFNHIYPNTQKEFYDAIFEYDTSTGGDFWVFWAESSPIKVVLKDPRGFFSIPRNQLKAAAMLVLPDTPYNANVKCTMYSNVLYDHTTGEFDPIKEEESMEMDNKSQISCRVHEVEVKGNVMSRQHSLRKDMNLICIPVTRKSSRTPRYESNVRKSIGSYVIKGKSTKAKRTDHGRRNLSRSHTQNFFYGGVSH